MVCPPSPRSCLHLSPISPLLSCFPLSPIAHCIPSCFLLLDGASAFRRVLSPHLVSLCWMVRVPYRRFCLRLSPIVPLLDFPCWMVCPPSRGSGLSLPPIVPLLVSPCWKVCSPCRRSCLPLSRIVPLLISLCWTPSRGVSHCTPDCFPLLAGVSAFPSILSPFSPHYLLSCPPNSVLL